MTMAQMAKRLERLEQTVEDLQKELEYRQAVDGIRRGLESIDRGEGIPVDKAFATLRQKHAAGKSRR